MKTTKNFIKLAAHIAAIADEEIRETVLNSFEFVPDYFWEIPSSSSGKYHPEDEICEGGLVVHTIKTIVVCKQMAPMLDLSQREIDLCVAALILHDTCKNGYKNSGHTVHEHPALAANLVCYANGDSPLSCEIGSLIKTHMGRWNVSNYSNVVLSVPATKLQQFVHMCDMFAAQKTWDIKY